MDKTHSGWWIGLVLAGGCTTIANLDHEYMLDEGVAGATGTTAVAAGGGGAGTAAGGGVSGTGTAAGGGVSGTGTAAGGGVSSTGTAASSTGAGGMACEGGGTCVDAAPDGWIGPFALYDGPLPAPACAAPFSVKTLVGFAGLTADAATCSQCTCPTPSTDATCSLHVVVYGGSACSSGGVQSLNLNATSPCAGNGSSVSSVRTYGGDKSGSCLPGATNAPVISPETWSRAAVGCAFDPSGSGSCGGSSVCGPPPSAPFEDAVCVSHPGDVACPSAFYGKKRLFYSGLEEDSRSCTPCQCYLSGDCAGELKGYSSADCSSQTYSTTDIAFPNCHSTTAPYFTFAPTPLNGEMCTPAGGDAAGWAQRGERMTVCCTSGGHSCGQLTTGVVTPSKAEYCIHKTEVTNDQHAAFLAANVPTQTQSQECAWNSSYVPKYLWPPNGPRGNYPVTYVDWCDASAYCKWAGMRLCGNVNGGPLDPADATSPNADAWYNACSNGGVLTYPYGNSFNTEACGGMFAQDAVAVKGNAGCEGGVDNVFDLSGNVAEWEDACNMTTGPDDMCLVRGGSYDSFQPAKFACTAAEPMKRSAAYNDVGFRCCSN